MLGALLTRGYTVSEQDVSQSVLGKSHVLVEVGEAGHVVVLGEGAESEDVRAAIAGLGAETSEVVEVTTEEDGTEGVVLHVVGHTGEEVPGLVTAEVTRVTGQDLTEGEDTGGVDEAGKELIVDVLGGVDAETVNGVIRNELPDPVAELSNDRLGFGGQISESNAVGVEPAVLVVGRVGPVGDVAVRVEVSLVVEGVELGVVELRRHRVELLDHVVDDDIDHDVHSAVVDSPDEGLKVLPAAELVVGGVIVERPVAVISLTDGGVVVHVLDDGADLDGGEAHVWRTLLAVRLGKCR